jgi:hypothetical protein
MRHALISDIHGHRPAPDAVLRDLETGLGELPPA